MIFKFLSSTSHPDVFGCCLKLKKLYSLHWN